MIIKEQQKNSLYSELITLIQREPYGDGRVQYLDTVMVTQSYTRDKMFHRITNTQTHRHTIPKII